MWNNFGTAPNNNYEKFFKALFEIEALPIEQWKTKHLVGYFCKKYYSKYNTVFKLSCNVSAPSKCRELYEIKRIEYMLSSDPNIVKNYIDWAFETQISKMKKRVTSLRFLTTESSIIEYKNILIESKPEKIERSSILPQNVLDIISSFCRTETTFGQLAFLQQCAKNDEELIQLLQSIEKTGFDLSILNKVC